MSTQKLDELGLRIMKQVRDQSIWTYLQTAAGHMKAPTHQRMHDRMKNLSEEEQALLKDVAAWMVDQTLHNFLWMFEQDEDLRLVLDGDDGGSMNAADISDGLCGELYTEDGWIHRFSEYPDLHKL